jgi:hypothetical protein
MTEQAQIHYIPAPEGQILRNRAVREIMHAAIDYRSNPAAEGAIDHLFDLVWDSLSAALAYQDPTPVYLPRRQPYDCPGCGQPQGTNSTCWLCAFSREGAEAE